MNGVVVFEDRGLFRKKASEIAEKGYFIADIHVHTSASDGIASPKKAAMHAAKKGIHIAISDHNTVPDFSKFSAKEKDAVIPAIEITSKEGIDIIAYFYNFKSLERFHEANVKPALAKGYKTNIPANDVLDMLGNEKCVVSIPHINYPVDPFRLNFKKAVKKKIIRKGAIRAISCMEAFNSAHNKKINRDSERLIERLGKHKVAGSDAHAKRAIGNALVYAKASTKSGFLDSIARGKCSSIAIKTNYLYTMASMPKVAGIFAKGFFK